MYLIVPLMVASVIAADAFAGEKERRTLEALLYTPTSDMELLVAKLLTGFVPALVVAWGGFALYALVANVAAWPVMGRLFFPTPMWWVLALWVAPAVAALGLGATVLVSARVNTFQEAYQIGGVVVLPLVLLVVGQAAGVLVLSSALAVALGAVFWAAAAALLVVGGRGFRRGELLARR
jgi:ABC-type Na+ efflux pump permease subunit